MTMLRGDEGSEDEEVVREYGKAEEHFEALPPGAAAAARTTPRKRTESGLRCQRESVALAGMAGFSRKLVVPLS